SALNECGGTFSPETWGARSQAAVCYLLKGLFPALVNGVTEIMIGSKDSARPFFYVNSIGLSDVKRLHLLESFY
ncbi:hypothetical protein, partial [Escherichia coli]|uniref:hypothetical protein n=1 Tax=Escherichia coli TaxID=562 RepID=UPI001C700009